MGIALLWVAVLCSNYVLHAGSKALTKTNPTEDVHLSGEQQRIVGGQEATEGQYPFAVALHYNGRFICTGSIISPTVVLTAAHCVNLEGQTQPASSFFINYGTTSRSSSTKRASVVEVKPHPDYSESTIRNDIAFLRTNRMEFDSKAGPVCLSTKKDETYDFGTSAGWGMIKPPILGIALGSPPEKLHYVELRVSSLSACNRTYNGGVTTQNICAQSPNLVFFKGICQGDSGGPFFVKDQSRGWVQIGIASFVHSILSCGFSLNTQGTSVYTRVSHFTDWLKSATNDEEICYV